MALHDATFERTANRPGAPGDYSLSEAKQSEASYWHGRHDDGAKLSVPALPGARILTLEEISSAELVREIDIEICVTERQGRMDIEALERQGTSGCSYV
ncbi:MAG: hypothetical protein J7M39_09250 [Anaerolineae bacterium]|nr:hypothetical protein [Anaerolineae bacterium]